MKHSRTQAAGICAVALAALAIAPLTAEAAAKTAKPATGTPVSIRVEGVSSTLITQTRVLTRATSIDPDGKPADACEGDTAAVALQDATHGHWTAGAFSSGLGYPVIGIRGESYPFTSSYYWSVWFDDKPATTGICGATLHAHESILFFPQCSQESAAKCPQGLFDPAVLALSAPTRVRVGRPVVVKVRSLANLTGKASPGAGVKLTYGKRSVKAGAGGVARLRFAKPGSYRVLASAPDSIRDELTVSVSR